MKEIETVDLPEPPAAWDAFRVPLDGCATSVLPLMRNVLNDAGDEGPVQTFLAAHPHLLTCLLPPGRDAWCWDRPRFGSELIPDFLLCTRNSTGFEWVMVELESPAVAPLVQNGLPGAKLREAQGQVLNWRIWLRDNIAYAQRQLGFEGLTAEARSIIVVGRRNSIATKHAKMWRELSTDNTQIMTYDRLLELREAGRKIDGGNHE